MADPLDRITMDPAIDHGKPVIRGLRYPVEMLLELLSSGMTIDEILTDYEDLEREDVLAALAFAARLSQIKRVELTGQWLDTRDEVSGWCPSSATDSVPLTGGWQDALHTLDLPHGNRTADAELNALSWREQRIVVTKDADFVNSFLLTHQPYKLPLISTGTIRNAGLETLLLTHLSTLVSAFDTHDFLEMSRSALIIHV